MYVPALGVVDRGEAVAPEYRFGVIDEKEKGAQFLFLGSTRQEARAFLAAYVDGWNHGRLALVAEMQQPA